MSVSVKLENITLSYDRHPAVHHLSGDFKSGSLTAIAGPNGAGKSTLLKGIAGILAPEEGRIVVDSSCAGNIAYLPQAAEIQRDFPLSVEHMVSMGFWQKTGFSGHITHALREQAREAIDAVGLRGFESRTLDTLSAGQLQRALFARLLLQDAKLILLDEPFNAIDTDTTLRLIEIVKRWHAEARTVICVLHDFHQIREIFPECLLMARECVAWGASKDALHPEKLLKARFFQPAYPDHAEPCEEHA
jgi:zinc/manganese transport system ATP-binding protein